MTAHREIRRCSQPRLQRYCSPPAELQDLIGRVAEHVAQYGPAREFQLRSGKEGQERFSFLHLDDQYAPYYQHRVDQARKKRRDAASAITTEASIPRPVETKDGYLERQPSVDRLSAVDNPTNHPVHADQVLGMIRQFNGGQSRANKYAQQDTVVEQDQIEFANEHQAPPTISKSRPTESHASQNLGKCEQKGFVSQETDPTMFSKHSSSVYIPYGVLQEVHLLDSTGTEKSGLNTYIVLSNNLNNKEEGVDSLTGWINLPSSEYPQCEPMYRLRPDTSTIFRAPHHRLLPVGFPLGAEVQQVDNAAASIVIRRTVEKGQRLYDVKDEFGDTYEDIPEEDLRLHSGGHFDFRLPHTL